MKEVFRGRQYIHLRGIVWLKWWCKQTFECAVEFDTRRYHFFAVYHLSFWGLPSGSVGKQSTCNAGDAGNVGLTPGSVGSSRGGHDNPLQYSCLESPMDGGAWWAAVHGVAKSWTRLSDFTFTFHFHALEKEMATHSSVLAWQIPGTGEPGGLPSMRSHRVGHD